MNDSTTGEHVLAAHLQPGETVQWQAQPGASRAGPRELKSAMVPGIAAGIFAAMIASAEGTASIVWLLVGALVASAVTFVFHRGHRLPGTARYAVTNRRLLILDDEGARAFGPGEVTYLDVERYSDGTVDLVWGDDSPEPRRARGRSRSGGGARAQFSLKQRRHKRGFLGLPDAEPAESLIRELLAGRQRQVAAAVVGPAVPSTGAMASGDDTAAVLQQDRQTLREPESGFAIDLPSAWKTRTTCIKRYRLLGIIPFEPAPKWSDIPRAGWNRVEVDPGLETATLLVNLDPPDMPADIDAVLNDRWAKALNLRTVESNPDVRVGDLQGFSVTHDLRGVGPQVGAGPIKVGFGSIKAELSQTQLWLRGPQHAVHVHYITPTDARELRSAITRVVETIRFEL